MSQALFDVLKDITRQTVEAHDPCDVVLGEVVSASPLEIRIEQNDVLTEEFLHLTDSVRDYDVDIEVLHTTENKAGGSGYPQFESHNHDYKGRKKIRVYNGLKVGETVIMMKAAGGQDFVVLSRNKNHIGLSGQWG